MDWDDEKFDRNELREHLDSLGILRDYSVDELLVRTTKNTRTGNEFGFKPTELSLGAMKGDEYYSGFCAQVNRAGPNIHHSEPDARHASSFWIRFAEQWFQIRAFCRGYEDNLSFSPYQCRIPFRDIVLGGIHLRSSYDGQRVTVHLSIESRRPAKYARYLPKVLSIGREGIFERHITEADFNAPGMEVSEAHAGPVHAVGDERLAINPGLWKMHRLTLNMTPRQYKLLWMCMVRLRLVHLDPDFSTPTALSFPRPMPPSTSVGAILDVLDFEKRYLVEGLLCHGAISVPEVDDLMKSLQRFRADDVTRILEGLFKWTRRGTIQADVRHVYRRVSGKRTGSTGHHHVSIRRCLVTPTRCILNPPTWETSNSMLRDHAKYIDRFLRVQFVDDDGDFPVTGETLVIDDKMQGTEGVFARVRRTLSDGIMIAGRHYVFATFSESQGRERGCWMVAEDPPKLTVSMILASMGDLSQERIIAKHAARQSLKLSTTQAIPYPITVDQSLADVTRNGYTFTDGVGHFTQRLANDCAALMGHRLGPVSAAQIRAGGVKGVLCVVRDESLQDTEIRVRPSMIKLRGLINMDVLNVLKVATYSKATLNRQAILLLEDRGVFASHLMELFLQEKQNIEGLDTGFDPFRLASISTFPVSEAIRHDVDDPLVQDILRLLKCRLLSDLKWKAWVEIDQSAYLMAVADETGILEEGQIFCQIQSPGSDPQVIKSKCTIYRNPCLHPGDVRLVDAVDCPELHHLRNVIVFNTKGLRDLPNMLSGGDVDGDCYSLIWDKRLLIPEDCVHEPMDYTPPTPVRSFGPVTIEQTKEHFVDLIKNDLLGRVCNAHMALADQLDACDPACLELAALASQAVDFPKTGVPVQQYQLPLIEEYPDFMGKDYKTIRVFKKQPIKSYPSEKVLGRMFRSIDPEPTYEEVEDHPGERRILELEDQFNYEPYLAPAAVHKTRYEFELTGLLRRYNISEVECVTGVMLRSPKTRLKVEKDHELRIAVREAYALLVAAAVQRIDDYLAEHPVYENPKDCRLAWTLASYKLTHDPRYESYLDIDWSRFDQDVPLGDDEDFILELDDVEPPEKRLSFPWLLSSELFALLS